MILLKSFKFTFKFLKQNNMDTLSQFKNEFEAEYQTTESF
jgi:hypothetical protein